MSEREEDYDSDAPEEFTFEQAVQQDEEIRKVQIENKARVAREGKERRRQWAQKKTPKPPQRDQTTEDVIETDTPQESQDNRGMLPNDIVELLAAREKHVFLSDLEEQEPEKKTKSKKKRPNSRLGPVILEDIPPPQCLQNSLEFLKKRKMQVARSPAVLNNANKALRLLSTSGLLSNK